MSNQQDQRDVEQNLRERQQDRRQASQDARDMEFDRHAAAQAQSLARLDLLFDKLDRQEKQIQDIHSVVFTGPEHETTIRGEIKRLDERIESYEQNNKTLASRAWELAKFLLVALLGWLAAKGWVDPTVVKDLAGP